MILVTGATGNIGRELVGILAAAGHQVRAASRKPGGEALPDGVTAVAADLNRAETFTEALAGVRGMFLMPGYDDMAGLLALARKSGVEHVVLLSGGSAGSGDRTNAVSRYMIDSEQAVLDSGIAWTFVRPRAFMSNALRWLPQLREGDEVRVPFADVRAAAIDPYDIAAVVGQALVADGHRGVIHTVSGPESLLPAEQIATLADILGRDLRCVPLSNDEARAQMSENTPAEYVDAFFRFYVDGELDESQVEDTVERVTGRAPRTFRQWAEAHADAFR